jgi:EmrB/QacA subfamily drug resistance transporter
MTAEAPNTDTVARSNTIALIVAAAFFMETLDSTVVITALPAMARSFGTSTIDASLCISAYLLAMAVFVPAAGWCAERFGARNVFALAMGVFTVASLLCALAPSFNSFVAARVLQGAAAAFMSPVGRLVVLRETPTRRLIEALGTITWPGLIAPVMGPVLGGAIVTYASWHWIFLLNIPLGLCGIWLALKFIPRRDERIHKRFDFAGFALTSVALASLILGLTNLGEQHANFARAVGLAGLGVIFGGLAIRHARRVDQPMLELRALKVRTFTFAIVTVGFASRIAINTAPYLLPLMFQIAFKMTALQAGAMVLIYMTGNLSMKSVTTRVLRQFGFRKVLVVNSALCAGSLLGCGLIAPGNSEVLISIVLFLAGMTRSMNFTATATLAYVDVPADQRAGASALASMLQQIAMTLSVALAAFTLSLSQMWRVSADLALADFQNVWFAVGLVMLLTAGAAWRLDRQTGAALTQPSS